MALLFASKPIGDLRIKSFTSDLWYTVDEQSVVCSCPAFQKRGMCKHLEALGLYKPKPYTLKTHPTFSQALSGLVKSLRIRKVEEAVYWLMYMDTFTEPSYRFRVARRLLIGSVEDGLSIAAMEKCAQNFVKLTKKSTELLYLVAEAVRICKLPNWWHTDSGGHDYVYQSLLGMRLWNAMKWERKLKVPQEAVELAIDNQDKAMAIGAVMMLDAFKEEFGATKQAEFLLELAQKRACEPATRLCKVHLSQKSALGGDNNFLAMAAWMMAGGVNKVVDQIEAVTAGECHELIEKAKEAWKTPHVIPEWCCDGIHCSGGDIRFAGMLPAMVAVCRAFNHYGRVEPEDQWLLEFRCLDGLQVKKV